MDLIFGNDLAGGAMLANVLLLPVVVSKPLSSRMPDEGGLGFPDVVPTCAAACVQRGKLSAPDPPVLRCSKRVVPDVVSLPDSPLSTSRED